MSPSAGKMQNYELVHSRVQFIYPSQEEMGDFTFIVAERKAPVSTASSSSRSFNVLLYLLVFQVRTSSVIFGINVLELFLEEQQRIHLLLLLCIVSSHSAVCQI